MTGEQKLMVERLHEFGVSRFHAVEEITHEGYNDGIGPLLIMAMGWRESRLHNVVGDGGHGRGWLQIDDRAWHDWLSHVPGVKSGTWDQHDGHSAVYPGHCPYMSRATQKAIDILRANMAMAKQFGIPAAVRLQFAVAAFNCGAGNALNAYRRGGINNIDRYTFQGNYSHDVLRVIMPDMQVALKLMHWLH